MGLDQVVKPKTRKGKRVLENKAPKLIENTKTAMFVRGQNASQIVVTFIKDMAAIKKPNSVLYNRKNAILPFEDQSTLEFFSQKSDCSLFMFGSHNKKRPHNIVIGRMFDGRVLDMIELGIENFKSLKDFGGGSISAGTKPMLVFAGEGFDNQPDLQRLQNVFIDFFRGENVESVRLNGLEYVLSFTSNDNKIFMRGYKALLKKSGHHTPRIELEEVGPSADFTLRRTKLASSDLLEQASRLPKQLKFTKVKNISRDAFGTKLGRIHMPKADMNKLQTRKLKALRKERVSKAAKTHGDSPATPTPMAVD